MGKFVLQTPRGPVEFDEDRIAELERTDPQEHAKVLEDIRALSEIAEVNPYAFLTPHGSEQRRYLEGKGYVLAAFAGNRFGKTTALVGKAYAQHVPVENLSDEQKAWRCVKTSKPTVGRLLCPSEQVLFDVLIPEMQKWAPKYHLLGGSWDKAWDKKFSVLRFADGGRIGFYTYKQDPETMEGAALDYVGYDEPPPEPVRRACLSRLADRDGFEMFAMTPVNMVGGGIGWIYREIYKQREKPGIVVVRGSGFDNPNVPKKSLERMLASFPEEERRAREFGEFMHFGGMVYPGGFEQNLVPVPSPKQLEGHDVVVGIDPGLKNAAFVWVAFDRDNVATVFDEAVVHEGTPVDWAKKLREVNQKWGVKNPTFVIDPSARNRSLVNAESVEGEFQRQGIYPIHGQNDVFAGVSQVRRRLQQRGLHIVEDCRGLRDEAEEYRAQDRPDQEFKVVKENDHRLDALRYALMSRPWYVSPDAEERNLGWVPGTAPSQEWFDRHSPVGATPPMGAFS
jgi:phage terminase large subunit-like protein